MRPRCELDSCFRCERSQRFGALKRTMSPRKKWLGGGRVEHGHPHATRRLGGILFTTLVVSPALKAMKWSEAERVGVRSVIGNQYARIGTANLVLLLVF